MRPDLNKNERRILFCGAIYQGDLEDAHAMLQDAAANRESIDAFPDQEAAYCAGRLAIVAHWLGNSTLVESALQIIRCIDAATDWAESLDNEDKQLQACVVLLNMATEHIGIASNHKRTPIAVKLGRINPSHMVSGSC